MCNQRRKCFSQSEKAKEKRMTKRDSSLSVDIKFSATKLTLTSQLLDKQVRNGFAPAPLFCPPFSPETQLGAPNFQWRRPTCARRGRPRCVSSWSRERWEPRGGGKSRVVLTTELKKKLLLNSQPLSHRRTPSSSSSSANTGRNSGLSSPVCVWLEMEQGREREGKGETSGF